MRLHTVMLFAFLALQAQGRIAAQASPRVRRGAELVLTIGSDTGAALRDSAARNISDVKVGRDGRIYVFDVYERAVKVFSDSGRFLFRFGEGGREGGLATHPEMAIDGSTVVVRDTALHRTDTFGLDGKLVRTQLIQPGELSTRRYRMRGGLVLRAETPLIARIGGGAAPVAPLYRTIGLERSPSRPLDTLFTIRSDTAFIRWPKVMGRDWPVVPRFGAGGAWTLQGDSIIAHADGYTGRVSWYSITKAGAQITRTASLGRAGESVTADEIAGEAARIGADMVTGWRAADSALAHVNEATLVVTPRQWSLATRALFADDGSLWTGVNRIMSMRAPTGERVFIGEANTWTVFPPHDAPFTVALRPLFRLTAVRGDKLYGYGYADNGDMLVTVYKLTAPLSR